MIHLSDSNAGAACSIELDPDAEPPETTDNPADVDCPRCLGIITSLDAIADRGAP